MFTFPIHAVVFLFYTLGHLANYKWASVCSFLFLVCTFYLDCKRLKSNSFPYITYITYFHHSMRTKIKLTSLCFCQYERWMWLNRRIVFLAFWQCNIYRQHIANASLHISHNQPYAKTIDKCKTYSIIPNINDRRESS